MSCFRPLSGILFFNEAVAPALRPSDKYCFRPLSGILFFNPWAERLFARPAKPFPSPFGDFVFQLIYDVDICHRLCTFPSPFGDFVFQQNVIMKEKWKVKNLFPSPFGDFVFQHNACTGDMLGASGQVSVPFRGFCFSTPEKYNTLNTLSIKFPSPFGDFVFQQSLRKALSFLA